MKIPNILKRNVRVDIDFCSQTAWVRIPLWCFLAVRSWASNLAFLCLGALICKTGWSSGPVHRIAVKMNEVTYAKHLARCLAPVAHSGGFVLFLLLFYGARQARSVFLTLITPAAYMHVLNTRTSPHLKKRGFRENCLEMWVPGRLRIQTVAPDSLLEKSREAPQSCLTLQ